MGVRQSRLTHEDMADLCENTSFSQKEILIWYSRFIGDYREGRISVENFKNIYLKIFPQGDASIFAEYVFRAFDTDCNGFLDFKEFLSSVYIASRGRFDQKLKVTFSLYDLDGDGFISFNEMLEVFSSIHKAMGFKCTGGDNADDVVQKRAAMLFRYMDLNNDGLISFYELMQVVISDKNIFNLVRSNPMFLYLSENSFK